MECGGNDSALAVFGVKCRSDVPVAFLQTPKSFPERGEDAASTGGNSRDTFLFDSFEYRGYGAVVHTPRPFGPAPLNGGLGTGAQSGRDEM
jgi:hypothetical protein